MPRHTRKTTGKPDEPDSSFSSETRYKSIFQHSAVSLWEEDISGLRAGLKNLRARGITDLSEWLEEHPDFIEEAARLIQVVDVNEATLALYEVAAPELLRGPLDSRLDLRDPAARESMRENILAIWEGRRYCAAESNAVTTSGRRIDIAIRMYIPPEDDSDYRYMLVSVLDISDRVKAEAALRRSEEQLAQARKMEAVGRLAGGIAHDFNNLIMVIRGYTELVEESLPDTGPARADIREVRRAVDRAADLTVQLLAFSRKQVLQPRIVNPNDIVKSMEKILPRIIGEDVEIALILEPDAGNIRADPGQIEQVIMNLAANARDAMPRGGTLSFRTENVAFDEAPVSLHPEISPGGYVLLTVSDTGMGMDGTTLERIFEPFFTTKELGKGTGLGLATVYGIIKQSGGYIFCSSEVGVGTTFQIYLPRAFQEMTSEAGPGARGFQQRGSGTILLVEDEEALRRYVHEVLVQKGYDVIEAGSAAEALESVSSPHREIDLLLTDVVLPRMSGPELGRRLRALRPKLRILYMSGYSEELVSRHGVPEPDADLIQKPFDAASLLARVSRSLQAARGA
ncbi:MAG TPA: ATP-binding protein [Spirochaetia bacterium]|nr:ATP-binding protein [Spirochaetia bacterium]